jgi:hypothetical protein
MPDAPKILFRNVYGWFVRVERGIYTLSESGRAALARWSEQTPLPAIDLHGPRAAVRESSSTNADDD